MKTNTKINEDSLAEMAISIDVEADVLDKVVKGEITHIVSDLNEENYAAILKNLKGNLVLDVDELPNTFYSCYYYNDGVFPYVIKDSLQFMVLFAGDKHCLAKIGNIETEPGKRFRFQGHGQPGIDDPNGNSCIWKIIFEVIPLREDSKTYLMRWNPGISSFTEGDYKSCVENMTAGGFRINWSISEWEEARRGDEFYMMRVGDDKAGIVFKGIFTSDPYVSDDWAGSTKRRLYVDMICLTPVKPGKKPALSLDKLQSAIPNYEWAKGHSGVLLSDEIASKLEDLWLKTKDINTKP